MDYLLNSYTPTWSLAFVLWLLVSNDVKKRDTWFKNWVKYNKPEQILNTLLMVINTIKIGNIQQYIVSLFLRQQGG